MQLARLRNLAAPALGVLLVASLTASQAQAGTSAGPAPQMLPAYAHGTITGAGPRSGVRLELVVWPSGSALAKARVGKKIPLRVIGKATSTSSGSYT